MFYTHAHLFNFKTLNKKSNIVKIQNLKKLITDSSKKFKSYNFIPKLIKKKVRYNCKMYIVKILVYSSYNLKKKILYGLKQN